MRSTTSSTASPVGTMAGEHPPGTISAVCGGREAQDEHPGLGIAEARYGPAPVRPVTELPSSGARHGLAVRDQPGTSPAARSAFLQDPESLHVRLTSSQYPNSNTERRSTCCFGQMLLALCSANGFQAIFPSPWRGVNPETVNMSIQRSFLIVALWALPCLVQSSSFVSAAHLGKFPANHVGKNVGELVGQRLSRRCQGSLEKLE